MISLIRLEKAARDNGFDVDGVRIDDWRVFSSSQVELHIWLAATPEDERVAAFSRWDIFEELRDHGVPWSRSLPTGVAGARAVASFEELHQMLRRAFQLARSLPDEPLQIFKQKTAHMPLTTEAERLVVQRVGQDVFRNGLLDYWERRCALTGLDEPALLLASHIKPWADCIHDEERLDVHNGLLLAPHIDAAFDKGFITFSPHGELICSSQLSPSARHLLHLDLPLRIDKLTKKHERYLVWHRARVFRGNA